MKFKVLSLWVYRIHCFALLCFILCLGSEKQQRRRIMQAISRRVCCTVVPSIGSNAGGGGSFSVYAFRSNVSSSNVRHLSQSSAIGEDVR